MTDAGIDHKRVPINYIIDEPADEDFFKTHSRLADAIAEAIHTNRKLKVIGLLGRWGSGKSTVIKHITAKLKGESGSKRYLVFGYDAWLHQSDPLRRSFLESLIADLDKEEIVRKPDWQARLEKLSGGYTESSSVETPILTTEAKILALSLLPVPIGMSLLGLDTIQGAFGGKTSLAGIWSLRLSLLLLLFPVITWIARLAYLGLWKMVDFSWFPPILANSSLGRSVTYVQRSTEPTSLEFGSAFQELLQVIQKAGVHLVIVIDNIDRVAADEAVQMWANIRSFFLASHDQNVIEHEPYHPTVILPIDHHAITHLFSGEGNDVGKTVADSFLDKTFDATFEVTEPVMSDWREFLRRQMREAFGKEINDKQIFWTRRFYENWLATNSQGVTPRGINKLVNRMASLLMQWRDEGIAFATLAYFAIYKDDIAKDVHTYVTTPQDALAALAPNWQIEIAALHFGVPPDKAAQVMMGDPIRKAILDGDASVIGPYVGVQGFGETFENQTVELPQSEGSPQFLVSTNAALLLNSLNVEQEVWCEPAWQNIVAAVLESFETVRLTHDFETRLSVARIHQLAGSSLRPRSTKVGRHFGFSTSSMRRFGIRRSSVVSATSASSRASCAPRQK